MKLDFLKQRASLILTAVLLLQAVFFWKFTRPEVLPSARSLTDFPVLLNGWDRIRDNVMDEEVANYLKADATLNRDFVKRFPGQPDVTVANLFIASFRSQRNGKTPHSPKNCLPGNGWIPKESQVVTVPVDGRAEPIEVNRFVVTKSPMSSLVLYWYQSRDRTVANEYRAKLFSMVDSVRYNRTDTAIVRVWTPITDNNEAAAEKAAYDLVRGLYPYLKDFLPH
jgi:EpsI family protein